MTAARALRRLARWAVLAALVVLVVQAASVRPALSTMIGFRSAMARAADRNARASPTDSI